MLILISKTILKSTKFFLKHNLYIILCIQQSPLYKATISAMKMRPYKRGGLLWEWFYKRECILLAFLFEADNRLTCILLRLLNRLLFVICCPPNPSWGSTKRPSCLLFFFFNLPSTLKCTEKADYIIMMFKLSYLSGLKSTRNVALHLLDKEHA